MAKADSEQATSYGAMERFLIWFLIPFVFTAVLLGVLLTIFDYDVMNSALRAASKIPVVKNLVPAAKTDAQGAQTPANGAAGGNQGTTPASEEQSKQEAEQQLVKTEQELQKAEMAIQERDQTIKDLQVKNSTLQEQTKTKTQSEEEYTAQIQQLASMYAKMSPSKSAPIMENLTPKEQVLVLSMMKTDDRVKILEKMDPKKAADASMALKDQISVKDTEIAALQERLKQATTPTTQPTKTLTKDDLGTTFSNMTPKSAATVLMEMQNTNPDKVISILSSMDSAGRSKIIAAISDQSKEMAALISARLVQ